MNATILPSPSLDAAEAVPMPSGVLPPQDWEQLVSPGHVMRQRLLHGAGQRFSTACLSVVGALLIGLAGPALLQFRVPSSYALALAVNPMVYSQIDGQGVSYRLEYMAQIPAQVGMSAEAWSQLLESVATDFATAGYEAQAWEKTATLAIAPRITRPGKVFQVEAIDRLSTGVVAVPDDAVDGTSIDLFGFVDGKLTWATLTPDYRGFRCETMLGFEVPSSPSGSCSTSSQFRELTHSRASLFKPVAVGATVSE